MVTDFTSMQLGWRCHVPKRPNSDLEEFKATPSSENQIERVQTGFQVGYFIRVPERRVLLFHYTSTAKVISARMK